MKPAPLLAGVSGLALVLLVVSFGIVGPAMVAGPRVTATLDAGAVRAYYGHAALAPLTVLLMPAAAAALVFFWSFREALVAAGAPVMAATLGGLFGVAQVPMYLGSAALGAALVGLASAGADVVPLFRFWDVYYNSAGYVLESAVLLSFSAALWRCAPPRRGLAGFGFAAGALQALNVGAMWLGWPDAATMPGNVALLAWLSAASILALRWAREGAAAPLAGQGPGRAPGVRRA